MYSFPQFKLSPSYSCEIIPGGSINKKTKLWRVKSGKYLFNHKALAKVFRINLLKEMVDNDLKVPKKCPEKWVVECKNGQVTFRYVESKSKTFKTKTVNGESFLWLLMQHILPKGFRKVRSYGFLHPSIYENQAFQREFTETFTTN